MVVSTDRTTGAHGLFQGQVSAAELETFQRLTFGPFVLDRSAKTLTRNRTPVRLRSREMDILLHLVRHADQIVSGNELIAGISPAASVSAANLRVQIAGLRRALAEGHDAESGGPLDRDTYIRDVNDEDYQFAARLQPLPPGHDPELSGKDRFPLPPTRRPPSERLIGRDADLARLREQLGTNRLVTLTGAPGIGKTALALAVADGLGAVYRDGVRFVDLSPLTDAQLVASAILMALDPKGSAPGAQLEDRLVKRLAPLNLLLVLDHCHPVADGVAAVVSLILERTTGVSVLATSRDRLDVDTQALYPVAPLDSELTTGTPSADAVRLFAERTRAAVGVFDPSTAEVAAVAGLCGRLGGNPRAIELAAGHVATCGLPALTAGIKAHLDTTTDGPDRTPLLDALLGWSYAALSPVEARVLRRLSIFCNDFTLASASAVAGDLVAGTAELEDVLAGLAKKALVKIDDRQAPAKYNLPTPIRAFAHAALTTGDEWPLVADRHAQRLLAAIRTSAQGEVDLGPIGLVHDIRAAINWAFSGQGDPLTGMQLIASAIEIGGHMPILAEYTRDLDRAIDHLEQVPDLDPKLVLHLLLERMSVYTHLDQDMEGWRPLTEKATAIAQALYETTRNPADLFEIKMGLFGKAFGESDGPAMMQVAGDLRTLAIECNLVEGMQITLDRTQTHALHFTGHHAVSLAMVDRILAYTDEAIRKRYFLPCDRLDQRKTIRIFQARSLWITGRGAAATEAALAALDMVRGDYEYITCYILAFALIPVHAWRGNMAAAAAANADLLRISGECGLPYWENWGMCYQQALSLHGYGDPQRVPQGFTQGLAIRTDHMATLHDALVNDATYRRADAGLIDWCAPDIFRAHAERALAAGAIDPRRAETSLQRALGLARDQGALAWELRAATSLARLWGYQGKAQDGIRLLEGVLGRFREGFGDADLITARALVADLSTR